MAERKVKRSFSCACSFRSNFKDQCGLHSSCTGIGGCENYLRFCQWVMSEFGQPIKVIAGPHYDMRRHQAYHVWDTTIPPYPHRGRVQCIAQAHRSLDTATLEDYFAQGICPFTCTTSYWAWHNRCPACCESAMSLLDLAPPQRSAPAQADVLPMSSSDDVPPPQEPSKAPVGKGDSQQCGESWADMLDHSDESADAPVVPLGERQSSGGDLGGTGFSSETKVGDFENFQPGNRVGGAQRGRVPYHRDYHSGRRQPDWERNHYDRGRGLARNGRNFRGAGGGVGPPRQSFSRSQSSSHSHSISTGASQPQSS